MLTFHRESSFKPLLIFQLQPHHPAMEGGKRFYHINEMIKEQLFTWGCWLIMLIRMSGTDCSIFRFHHDTHDVNL